MTTREGMPADWYEDPAKVGELRYFDGTRWTEHVTIDGVQTTAPYTSAPASAEPAAGADVDLATMGSFSTSRDSQWRTEVEKPVEVVGPGGRLGQFTTLLDGAPGYRFEDAQGGTVFTLSKPSLKATIEVSDPAGYLVGTITKVGRLRSRYDITIADGDAKATVRLLSGSADEWELQTGGGREALITRSVTSPADSLNFAAVSYAVSISAPFDDLLKRLLLAIPLAIDILDTQALTLAT